MTYDGINRLGRFFLTVFLPVVGIVRAANLPIMQTFTEADKLALGSVWRVTEPNSWTGFWVQRANTGALIIFDASWKNASGAVAKDALYVQSWNRSTGQITFYRQGNAGQYKGVFGNDRIQSGTASWYASGWTWSAMVIRRQQDLPDDIKGTVTLPH